MRMRAALIIGLLLTSSTAMAECSTVVTCPVDMHSTCIPLPVHCDPGIPSGSQITPATPWTVVTVPSLSENVTISSRTPRCPDGYTLVADSIMQPKCARMPLREPDY